jgi:predicted metal-dependent hydrolase
MPSGEELLQEPGELYRISVLVKVFNKQHYVIGIEADRAANPSQVEELLELATAICIKAQNGQANWKMWEAAIPVFTPEKP